VFTFRAEVTTNKATELRLISMDQSRIYTALVWTGDDYNWMKLSIGPI